ncbi:hypothetical protein [Vibrio harveyi]|uniref:hypothetical protein n=1 Tax=Vibrio harveyi TaxID=669 RepID=UPI003BB676A6
MNEQYIRELISLTSTRSQEVIDATIEHICFGVTQSKAAEKQGVKQAAVARLTTQLKHLNEKIERLIELKKKS